MLSTNQSPGFGNPEFWLNRQVLTMVIIVEIAAIWKHGTPLQLQNRFPIVFWVDINIPMYVNAEYRSQLTDHNGITG